MLHVADWYGLCKTARSENNSETASPVPFLAQLLSETSRACTIRDAQPLSTPTCAVLKQHSGTGSSSHQTSSERQTGLPRIPGSSANDSRLLSNPHDPEGASSMGGRR